MSYICLLHSLHILGALPASPRDLLIAVEALCLVGNELLQQNFERLGFGLRPLLRSSVLHPLSAQPLGTSLIIDLPIP